MRHKGWIWLFIEVNVLYKKLIAARMSSNEINYLCEKLNAFHYSAWLRGWVLLQYCRVFQFLKTGIELRVKTQFSYQTTLTQGPL